jgi:hypothetical protein
VASQAAEDSDEQKNAPKLAIGCFLNVTITLANWVILNVTRIPQGIDGCSAGAA